MIKDNLMRNEKGYALIEVVFLVAIVAILSSIAVPKISNELQIAQADYLMKSLYSELRFMQAARRTSAYKEESLLPAYKNMNSLNLVSSNINKRYRIRFGDNEELRRYNLPSAFSFEKDFFITVMDSGTLSNDFLDDGYSGNIKLINNRTHKLYKPFIVFDSVGRIRFSNDSNGS